MIADIRLRNFRSYQDELFELSPRVNIVVGPNASGKTNLLEALLVVSRGSSYRSKDKELIKHHKPWLNLQAHTTSNENRIVKIEIKEDKTDKQFVINKLSLKRLNLQKTIPTVLFEPNHLRLLNGGPEKRREFLDELLEQIRPGFSSLRRQYRRALSQRNALLKTAHKTEQMFVWNVRLSELGEQISLARSGLIQAMSEQAPELYNSLARAKEHIAFDYRPTVALENYATALLHKLEKNITLDKERGFTSSGPHREDFKIHIDNHDVQGAASRGEIRTLLLVCKILEARLIEQARDTRPILLLDDVFSELDGGRRQALTNFLQPYQTFITTTDADVVVQHFTEKANIIPTSSS